MTDLLRKAWVLAGVKPRSRWLIVVALSVVVTAVEAVGALLVLLLLSMVSNPDGPWPVPVLGDLSDRLPDASTEYLLIGTGVAVVLFFVLRGGVVLVQTYVRHRIADNTGAAISAQLARRYLHAPYALHLQIRSASVIRNTIESSRKFVGAYLVGCTTLLADSILTIGLLAILLATAPLATGIAVAFVIPLVLVLQRSIQPRMKRLGRHSQDTAKESLQVLQQSLHAIRDITLLGRAEYFATQFARSRHRYARAHYVQSALSTIPTVVLEAAMVLLVVVFVSVLVLAGVTVGEMVSVVGLFAYIGFRLKPVVQHFARVLNNMRFAEAALDDLYEDYTGFATVTSGEEVRETDRTASFTTALELDAVTFRYGPESRPALEEVNLVVRKGEALGICGPTGGGKSTLVDIMVGLLDPTEGEVRVDGRPLPEARRWWQRQIGVVPQQVVILDDTLRRNVAFGVADGNIDGDRVLEVLAVAQLESLVDELDEGLDTRLGERGIRLSGGQRQRVAIARALYHDPQVVVFDEGTSALDNRTEAALVNALEAVRHDHTLIMVAHRLRTVRNADRILYVDEGRITDSGTMDELLARNELFQLEHR